MHISSILQMLDLRYSSDQNWDSIRFVIKIPLLNINFFFFFNKRRILGAITSILKVLWNIRLRWYWEQLYYQILEHYSNCRFNQFNGSAVRSSIWLSGWSVLFSRTSCFTVVHWCCIPLYIDDIYKLERGRLKMREGGFGEMTGKMRWFYC